VDAADLMADGLRTGNLIPAAQPYAGAPFAYAGTETVAPAVLAVTGPDAIVDWVLLELRSNVTPATILHRRAALVQRDGDIVDTDGTSPVRFLSVAAGNYHVAVRHRNHLGVMTASPVALSATPAAIDFTSAGFPNYGTSPALALLAQKDRDGKRMLWAGNVVSDSQVQYAGAGNDREPILVAIGSSVPTNTVLNVYSQEDVRMDGDIKYAGAANDREPILVNIGGAVPTAIRVQQLP
jgi:hypothetical protein